MNEIEMLLLKLGEVVLKGQNRLSFEDRLTANVRRRLKSCGSFEISLRQSTIYVEPTAHHTGGMEDAFRAAQQVFGVVSVARAVPCGKNVEEIAKAAITYLAGAFARAKSFKVESKRADKQFPMNSIQISQAVGALLAEAFPSVAVDVHHPELTVFVEIREKCLRPYACRTGRRRASRGHRRSCCQPAFRRSRQPRFLLDDGKARRGTGDGPFRLASLYLPAGAG